MSSTSSISSTTTAGTGAGAAMTSEKKSRNGKVAISAIRSMTKRKLLGVIKDAGFTLERTGRGSHSQYTAENSRLKVAIHAGSKSGLSAGVARTTARKLSELHRSREMEEEKEEKKSNSVAETKTKHVVRKKTVYRTTVNLDSI